MGLIRAMIATFALGVIYFIAAIPAGVGMGLPVLLSAFCAWLGYTLSGWGILLLGEPARQWMEQKFNFSVRPNPEKLIWRMWSRWGLAGVGLLAPVTCGPCIAALLALSLGERPWRILFWIAVGVLPWCLGFGILVATGSELLKG
ncbi:MAG: small multi-drug export protein [Chthoniobacterales bacterium]